MLEYVPTYTKGTLKKKFKKKKKKAKDLPNNAYAMFLCECGFFSDFHYKSICFGYSYELHQQVDAIQMGTHNICLYKEVDKEYSGCNLKTMVDCVLIGVCAITRSNMVCWGYSLEVPSNDPKHVILGRNKKTYLSNCASYLGVGKIRAIPQKSDEQFTIFHTSADSMLCTQLLPKLHPNWKHKNRTTFKI